MTAITVSQLQYEIAHATDAGPDTSTASQQLVDKFQALFAQGTPQTQQIQQVQQVQPADHADIVTKAVNEQADYYRQVPNDVLYMTQHMSSLSMERMAAADMTVQFELTRLNVDLQVKMAAVQSSKDAVQTLMKNQ